MSNQSSIWQKPYVWVIVGVLLGLLAFWLVNNSQSRPAATSQGNVAPPVASAGDDALLVQRSRNQALEEEVKRLEQALLEDPCKVLRMLEQGNPSTTPLAPGVLPENSNNDPDGTPAPDKPNNVAELLEQATVFIIAIHPGEQQVATGSGFFVAPGMVMTNAHVIGGEGGKIIAGNPALGGMRPADLKAISKDEAYDFALLNVRGAGNMPYLRIADTAKRTQKISAWGFPGFITGDDPKLKALIDGDFSAAPEVVYSEGVVSVVLDKTPPMIVHTASLSQGNSGGPLVDENGVVVGINTLISMASGSYAQSSVALPGKDIAAFLKANGVQATPSNQ